MFIALKTWGESTRLLNMAKIKEFHLFAGIGGGIYGGELLGNECCGGDYW